MIEKDLLQVLWVDNDPKAVEYQPLMASECGLQLKQFLDWEEAYKELESNYNEWSAIILNPECKLKKNSVSSPIQFLGKALSDIKVLSSANRGRIIHWYILTDSMCRETSDAILSDREEWDKDWTDDKHKNYYLMPYDTEDLYKRISKNASKSYETQIKEMYKESCSLLEELDSSVCKDIINILGTMHFPESNPCFTPRLYYNPMRIALEYVFRAANEVGIIPDYFIPNGKVNLNQCFMYVTGKPAIHIGYKYKDTNGFVPSYIQEMMSLILNLGNTNSHSKNNKTKLSDDEIKQYDEYLEEQGVNSKLLIFSIALQFCEIVKWFDKYIKEHPNKEENLRKCISIEEDDKVNVNKNNSQCLIVGHEYEGTIIVSRGLKKIKCEVFPYFLKIEGGAEDLYEDDKVLFTAQSRPNDNDSSKTFWFPTNVRLKDE